MEKASFPPAPVDPSNATLLFALCVIIVFAAMILILKHFKKL